MATNSNVHSVRQHSAEHSGIRQVRHTREIKPPVIKLRRGDIDYTFLFMVVLVLSVGLVMLLSASAPAARRIYSNSYYFFLKQVVCAVIGLVLMNITSKTNYNSYKKYIPMALVICTIALVLVLLPGTGVELNGSKRWLRTPFVQLQPSEFMKPIIAMFFALLIENGKYSLKTIRGVLPYGAIMMVVLALMLMETHLSGAIVIAGIGLVVMVAGGVPVKPIAIGGIAVCVVGVIVVKNFSPVRWDRILSFLHPFSDAQNTSYQISQGLYAIGSGKIFGLGLGQSIQKYTYLPEPYNDFIFAVVCEELGLVGATIIIAMFAALILRAIHIASNAPDLYSALVAIGITAHLAIQTILNIAVATSSVPNTGVSLPFFSYGGTSIITLLIEMGVLLNISRYSVKPNIKG